LEPLSSGNSAGFFSAITIGVGGLIAALRYPAENVEKTSILALDLTGS
jgi:hypothetical protein